MKPPHVGSLVHDDFLQTKSALYVVLSRSLTHSPGANARPLGYEVGDDWAFVRPCQPHFPRNRLLYSPGTE